MNGFLLIDKPSGWTSRDVCNKAQKILNEDKIGHTGTLDPFATGLLILTIGKATKAGIYLEDDDKEYLATIKLGEKTSTGDLTGEVIETKEINEFSEEDVIKVFDSLLGEQEQIPPMTSAIHYQGAKLYELAHQGIEVERKPRKIRINYLKLISYSSNSISFRCSVSKGTYIRVLGEEIASRLNNIGHLSSLRRTSIGHFDLENAVPLLDVTHDDIIDMMSVLIYYLPHITVDDALAKRVKDGAKLTFKECKEHEKILIINNEEVIAIYEREEGDLFRCLRGLW